MMFRYAKAAGHNFRDSVLARLGLFMPLEIAKKNVLSDW